MAITLTAGTRTAEGKDYEPILEELLFENNTVGKELVAFADDIKGTTEITEVSATVSMQTYTEGAPTSGGSLTSIGKTITPVKVMYYHEFGMNALRFSRYGKTMKSGAWETASSEFEKVVLGLYGSKVSLDAEAKFWSNATAATKTAVAALTAGTGQTSVGAAEQTYVASLTAGLFDGVVTRMIYNYAAVGGRIKVAGTTISSSNIKTEYDKLYAAIPGVVLNQADEPCRIYAPFSHIQLINIFNNNAANYKDVFVCKNVGKPDQSVTFNGLEVVFVPLPENCLIASRPSHLLWATDLASDMNYWKLDKIAANRDDMFTKHVFTIFAHVANQAYNVLYLG